MRAAGTEQKQPRKKKEKEGEKANSERSSPLLSFYHLISLSAFILPPSSDYSLPPLKNHTSLACWCLQDVSPRWWWWQQHPPDWKAAAAARAKGEEK